LLPAYTLCFRCGQAAVDPGVAPPRRRRALSPLVLLPAVVLLSWILWRICLRLAFRLEGEPTGAGSYARMVLDSRPWWLGGQGILVLCGGLVTRHRPALGASLIGGVLLSVGIFGALLLLPTR
jgi:hypothetical protein